MRVSLHSQDLQAEGGLELRVGDVGLLEPQTARPDESFVFRGLSCEVLWHEADLFDDSLPGLSLPLSGSLDLEHLRFRHGSHLRDWDAPSPCLLFSLLFDRVAEDL